MITPAVIPSATRDPAKRNLLLNNLMIFNKTKTLITDAAAEIDLKAIVASSKLIGVNRLLLNNFKKIARI